MNDPLEKAIDIIVKAAEPDKIILFGSRVLGTSEKESDYDIYIIKGRYLMRT